MDETLKFVLGIVGGAVGAAVLTFLGGLVGAAIQARREHKRWLREQRYEVYKLYLSTVDKWAIRASDAEPLDDNKEFFDEMVVAEAGVDLLGPKSVIDEMEPMRAKLLGWSNVEQGKNFGYAKHYWDSQRRFTKAAQKQLGFSSEGRLRASVKSLGA